MNRPIQYPRIRTVRDRGSNDPHIEVTWVEAAEPVKFCGASWCSGRCGLPALVIPPCSDWPRGAKAYSDMVACGSMMQGWRVTWTGEMVEIPEEHRTDFAQRMWW